MKVNRRNKLLLVLQNWPSFIILLDYIRKWGAIRVSFTQACNFIKKETLAQVFSCDFCEISKNTFFTEHLGATASAFTLGRLI